MKLIKSIVWNRSLILNNRRYLKPGIYVLHPCLRAYTRLSLVKKNPVNLPITQLRGLKHVVMSIIRHFFLFVVWKKNYSFSGEAVYFSNTPVLEKRELKIFSLDNKKVLIKAANEESFRENIKLNTLVTSIFSSYVPRLSIFNADAYLYAIDYISNYSRTIISKDILLRLFEMYNKYYSVGDKRITTIAEEDVPGEFDFCVKHIGKPCVEYLHHGDLSRDNMIITTDNKLYLIDFEHLSYYPQFYDVFYYLINTEVCISEDQIDFYDTIGESFKHFNYDSSEMLHYFELYVIYFYKNHRTVFHTSQVYRNIFIKVHDRISQIINT